MTASKEHWFVRFDRQYLKPLLTITKYQVLPETSEDVALEMQDLPPTGDNSYVISLRVSLRCDVIADVCGCVGRRGRRCMCRRRRRDRHRRRSWRIGRSG